MSNDTSKLNVTRVPEGQSGKAGAKLKAKRSPWTDAQRAEFMENAPPSLKVEINGVPVGADLHIFSSGSVGYNLNGKVANLIVKGKPVQLQVTGYITVIGSKPGE